MIIDYNKISQIGIVVRDIDNAMKQYWEKLSVGPWDVWTLTPENTEMMLYGKPSNHKFTFAETMVGDICLELIQHLEGDTIYKEFLEKRGEGLHHIQYMTNNIDEALEQFQKAGIGVIQSGKVEKDSYYYLDTESTLGIILELATNFGFIPSERTYPPK